MASRRALLSVSDKTGLVDLARGLAAEGVQLISTGGTATALRDAGLEVTDVSQVTGHPEIMGGRVKTLHPRVHGGILARKDHPGDAEDMAANGIEAIDMVVVNLYPFKATISRQDVTPEQARGNIDIGGPCMIRASAKNFIRVASVVDPADYPAIAEEMATGGGTIPLALRYRLACKAFAHTADYDAAIAGYLADTAYASVEKEYQFRDR